MSFSRIDFLYFQYSTSCQDKIVKRFA